MIHPFAVAMIATMVAGSIVALATTGPLPVLDDEPDLPTDDTDLASALEVAVRRGTQPLVWMEVLSLMGIGIVFWTQVRG